MVIAHLRKDIYNTRIQREVSKLMKALEQIDIRKLKVHRSIIHSKVKWKHVGQMHIWAFKNKLDNRMPHLLW